MFYYILPMTKTTTIQVPVEPEMKRELGKKAKYLETSVAAVVRIAIKKYLREN